MYVGKNIMPTRAGCLELPLTPREIECIISWKEDVFWPDEARLINKLRRAMQSAEPLTVSRVQLRIIWGWAEEEMGGHLGRPVLTTELRAIVTKLEPLLH